MMDQNQYKTDRKIPLKAWMRSEQTQDVFNPPCKVLLLDGGVSTFLEKKVEKFNHNELWSSSLLLERNGQKAIQECHETFYKVGLCDIISTVTYQCHYLNCPQHGNNVKDWPKSEIFNESEIDELLQRGIQLANEARRLTNQDSAVQKMTRYITASIGCYGGALADGSEYRGNYGITVQDLISFHKRRFDIFLSNPNIDGIVFETIPCVVECEAIISLLSQGINKAVWISMACRDGEHLNDGSALTVALDRIDQLDPHAQLVDGVGVNCCSLKYGKISQSMCQRISKYLSFFFQHQNLKIHNFDCITFS